MFCKYNKLWNLINIYVTKLKKKPWIQAEQKYLSNNSSEIFWTENFKLILSKYKFKPIFYI